MADSYQHSTTETGTSYKSAASSSDRRGHCQNSARKLWLCPHESLSFEDAQQRLAGRGPRSTCGSEPCQTIFTQVFFRQQRKASKERILQLITSIHLFDIACPGEPEEACRRYCTLDRIATVLHGLHLPICSHLDLASTFILSHLDLNSIPILDESCYIDRCSCHRRLHQPASRLLARCRHASHCLACLHGPNRSKTAFFLQASIPAQGQGQAPAPAPALQSGNPPHLTIRLNIARNLGPLQHPDDLAWRTHASTPLALHHMAIVRHEYDANLPQLSRLRRQWLDDLTPREQKIQGEVLDVLRDYLAGSGCQREKSDREGGLWNMVRGNWRWGGERRRMKWLVEGVEGDREADREGAVRPAKKGWLLASMAKVGICGSLRERFDRTRGAGGEGRGNGVEKCDAGLPEVGPPCCVERMGKLLGK